MKKLTAIVLCLTMLTALLACTQEEVVPNETAEPLYDGIIHYDNLLAVLQPGYPLKFDYFEVPYQELQPTSRRQHSDSRLQQMVQEQIPPTTLDSEAAITAHAWNLEPILEKTRYFPEEYIPVAAATFTNNVVLIVYAPPYYIELREIRHRFENSVPNDTTISKPHDMYYLTEEGEVFVLVSAKDGHVIYTQ